MMLEEAQALFVYAIGQQVRHRDEAGVVWEIRGRHYNEMFDEGQLVRTLHYQIREVSDFLSRRTRMCPEKDLTPLLDEPA